ncbi:MAG TPA: glycosyltransferase family A protein [Chitinophagaceae bacterium]|nr:glycosyltransferase family A protein [Chitinophagaceae bacterium]
MDESLVSVVMPVYNAARYLEDSIHSLLGQTYINWELIAVDDGSTDDSWQILNSYNDPRIKCFQRKNGGQCAATNTGLQHISGNYILFFDADDLMDKDKIRIQVETLQKTGDNTIAVSRWAFFRNSIEDAKFIEEPIYYSGKSTDWLYRLWTYETMMPNHGYLIPKAVWEKAGKFYDETIFQNIDFEYFTRIVLAADNILYCPDSICYYRKGIIDAKTNRPKFEKKLSALESRRKAIGYLLKYQKNERSIFASKMALTILTYSYPEILPHSKKILKEMSLGKFGKFGGNKFRLLSALTGFSNAIRIKKLLKI